MTEMCVLPEGILIRELLGTPLLPVGTACILSSVNQKKDGPGFQMLDLIALLASWVECEKRAEWYPSSYTFISITHLPQEGPHCQTLQRMFITP